MSTVVKLSSKNQIVIPKEVREALGLTPGDRLIAQVVNGRIDLWPCPKDYAQAMLGLHRHVWEGIDVKAYLESLRTEWEK